jgi:hypothetical protein
MVDDAVTEVTAWEKISVGRAHAGVSGMVSKEMRADSPSISRCCCTIEALQ